MVDWHKFWKAVKGISPTAFHEGPNLKTVRIKLVQVKPLKTEENNQNQNPKSSLKSQKSDLSASLLHLQFQEVRIPFSFQGEIRLQF